MSHATEQLTARTLTRQIADLCSRGNRVYRFMEVCGTHTMAIHEAGLKSLLPANVELVSGPGCPVCVTEKGYIDRAIATAKTYDATLVTFGDLVRVPGSSGSLASFRAEGGDVRVVYSPMDTIHMAVELNPKPVVFLGIGFETTIPTVAATVKAALARGIRNLYVINAFKTIHPPLRILAAKEDLHGFLLPGHVSAILGSHCYAYLADDYGKSGVVAGFEGLDILLALRDLVSLAVEGRAEIRNHYARVARPRGNPAAQALMEEVLEPCDAHWRGLGTIPGSGLRFRGPYQVCDAGLQLPVHVPEATDDPRCRCAEILTGSKTPNQCGLFGRECTPDDPVGPCMVSSEGTCAAYYKYG